MRRRHRGFSLVELMIALAIAMVTSLIVLQVLANYQARKQTSTGHNDAQINASVGLYFLEREMRMAGSGLMSSAGPFCNAGVNIYYNGTTVANGAVLRPLQIIDGGTGPDSIEVLRSSSESGAAPTTLLKVMASQTSPIWVDSSLQFSTGDLMLAGAGDGSKVCTLMQLTQAPQANGSGWNLVHDNTSPYNAVNPPVSFTTAPNYDFGDKVVNLGTQGLRRFTLLCNDNAAPSATNDCDLVWYPRLQTPATPTLANVESLAPQFIDLQAQYGIAPAGSQTVNQWVDATGSWAAPSIADQQRIKAVRVAVVARGNREATAVSPATITLWDASLDGTARTRALSTAERRYRYQVLRVVVPVINVIWAGE